MARVLHAARDKATLSEKLAGLLDFFRLAEQYGRVRKTLAEITAGEIRAELARQQKTGGTLAREMKVSEAYISRRLTGEVALDLDDLERIAAILSVSIRTLVRDEVAA